MIDDLSLYFDLSGPHELVEPSQLVPSKASESQPTSVANAEDLMHKAARGLVPKRPPLLVQRNESGLDTIVDGNATFAVALSHGFRLLPVVRAP